MSTLSERLIEARTDKGWSKAELKRAAGLKSASTLPELENGSRTESPQLPVIAAALGVSVLWLQHNRGGKYDSTAINQAIAATIQPKSKRELRIDEIVALLRQTDMDGLAVILDRAKDAARDYPVVKQTHKSSG